MYVFFSWNIDQTLIFIFKKDFHIIICAIYSLLGNRSNQMNDLETLQQHANAVFQKFDKFNQGYITIENFMSFCLQVSCSILNEEITNSFLLESNDNSID